VFLFSIRFSAFPKRYFGQASTDVIADEAGQYEMGVCSL
jgi:hypothetical protein